MFNLDCFNERNTSRAGRPACCMWIPKSVPLRSTPIKMLAKRRVGAKELVPANFRMNYIDLGSRAFAFDLVHGAHQFILLVLVVIAIQFVDHPFRLDYYGTLLRPKAGSVVLDGRAFPPLIMGSLANEVY